MAQQWWCPRTMDEPQEHASLGSSGSLKRPTPKSQLAGEKGVGTTLSCEAPSAEDLVGGFGPAAPKLTAARVAGGRSASKLQSCFLALSLPVAGLSLVLVAPMARGLLQSPATQITENGRCHGARAARTPVLFHTSAKLTSALRDSPSAPVIGDRASRSPAECGWTNNFSRPE